mgnify:CR=1 FL=1
MTRAKIIYTQTDEAPALATFSLLPIISHFTMAADIDIELSDISLAGRVIASFPEYLLPEQQIDDALAQLGEGVLKSDTTIIKLPNISASIPQLNGVISELQAQGYALPNYPESPTNDEQKAIKQRYDKIKGSAVNPVLREGNSDRRAPPAVKNYVRNKPHFMGKWSTDSKSHVASMADHDFFATEQSITLNEAGVVRIEHTDHAGNVTVLKQATPVLKGEIIDSSVMSKKALRHFIEAEINRAKEQGVLFSVHLKATMMKVSDPIIFGHVVSVFYQAVFEKYATTFNDLGIDPNNGLGDVYSKIKTLSAQQQAEIEADIQAVYKVRPDLAMVDSDKGITNLHVPSHVIVDASMPAMIRGSGQMWNKEGTQQDTKALIPDRCYAGIYQKTIEFCKQHGAFDPTTMGSVPNVGLMAQKAEEYGSHDKTFEVAAAGTISVVNEQGLTVLEHAVEQGDIWRMCQAKDAPIQGWVKLAVNRARLSNTPAVFWLDNNRAHDAQLIAKVEKYLPQHDTTGLDIQVLSPEDAIDFSMERIVKGQDTISVTGNVLRDYLTDLFPILELGTSAKMLSIVPLMNGGGLFETGAGGTAPKLVEAFENNNHFSWDSLGEFLALSASLEHLSNTQNNTKAQILANTLEQAITLLLDNNRSPSGREGEVDNRGSHFYLGLYWAQALTKQSDDLTLQTHFANLASQLADNEQSIMSELNAVQGEHFKFTTHYIFDKAVIDQIMRPSKTLNSFFPS